MRKNNAQLTYSLHCL